MLAIVAPGQGAQRPGLLSPWLEVDGVTDHLEALSEAAQLDLVAAGTTWDADAIRPTEVAQPLVVAASLIAARVLRSHGVAADVTAGHSVGEWTAAVVAGVLDESDAMRVVGARGRAMAVACAAAPSGMSAILGGDRSDVLARLVELGLIAANDNGSGQLVAGGSLSALEELAENPPEGSRVRPLAVAGAFHTAAMAPAVTSLKRAATTLAPRQPEIAFLSNRDGALVDSVFADGGVVVDPDEIISRLIEQVAAPVRWDLCTQTLRELGITALIELAPAGTLAGLARRGLPGVAALSFDRPDQLDTVLAGIAASVPVDLAEDRQPLAAGVTA